MKKNKKIVIVALILLLAGGGEYIVTRTGKATIEVPTLSKRFGHPGSSSEFLNAQRAAEYYREAIRKKPDAVKNYVALAQLFLQESRITGNHHEYIPKARMLLDEALTRDSGNFEANITKASLLMTLHKFQEAKAIAEKSILQQPYSAISYGVLVDANVELGRYDEAVQACDKMLTLRPDLRSYSRASYLRELHGDINGAVDAMKLAANASPNGQEDRTWALYNLGKLFLNEGKLDTAEYIFKGVLQERPEYGFALSGLAQIRRSEVKMQDAIDLLGKAYQTTPEHLFIEQLADVYYACGQKEAADGVMRIVLQMFEQHEKDGWNVNREYAMFCANHGIHLADCLERIESEYNIRPNNIDVLETYAWLLYKMGKAREAVSYIDRALQLHTQNFLLYRHAGLIYAAAGMQEKAAQYLEMSQKENPFVTSFVVDGSQPSNEAGQTTASIQ